MTAALLVASLLYRPCILSAVAWAAVRSKRTGAMQRTGALGWRLVLPRNIAGLKGSTPFTDRQLAGGWHCVNDENGGCIMIVEVVIEQDRDRWFAASHIEADYFCEGLSLSETVNSFIGGFMLTLQRNDLISAFVLRPAPAASKLPPKGELHRIVTRDFTHEQSLSEFTVEFRFWLAAAVAAGVLRADE